MILSHIALSGFRGFKRPVRIEFSPAYTVIDGRNGSGKSTICDAVEFALTGTISKYLEASSARETVTDYIWWCGDSDDKVDRYVEVEFQNSSGSYCIRRTPYGSPDEDVAAILVNLVDVEAAPPGALRQVCSATIIRDEHIARLSLDLKDVDRYSLLLEAIGASDADEWVRRSATLLSSASDRLKVTTRELEATRIEMRNSVMELDRIRTQLSESTVFENSVAALQELLKSTAPAEEIGNVGRSRLADIASRVDVLQKLLNDSPEIERIRQELPTLDPIIDELHSALVLSEAELGRRVEALGSHSSSSTSPIKHNRFNGLLCWGRTLGCMRSTVHFAIARLI